MPHSKTAKLSERHFFTMQRLLLVHKSRPTVAIVKLFLKNRAHNINYDDDDDDEEVGYNNKLLFRDVIAKRCKDTTAILLVRLSICLSVTLVSRNTYLTPI